MKLIFSEHAWDDYMYWQKTDKKVAKRINMIIKDIQRNKYEGIGKPEPLKLVFYSLRRFFVFFESATAL